MRETWSGLLAVFAECENCGWTTHARNGLGLSAQHHDRTGHVVSVEQTIHVRYGGGERRPKEKSQ